MADLINFQVVRAGNVQLTVPTWTISGRVIGRGDGLPEINFTGGNAISFPQVLGQLTTAQQDEWVQHVVLELLQKRLGF